MKPIYRSRREIVTLLAKVAGLAFATSGCGVGNTGLPFVLEVTRGNTVDARQLALLAELVDTIIPATDTGGARATGVHLYINMMLSNWFRPDEAAEFTRELDAFTDRVRMRSGKNFIDLDLESREKVLTTAFKYATGVEQRFLAMLREMTLTGYYTSHIGATEELQYFPVPGRFDGCITLDSNTRASSV